MTSPSHVEHSDEPLCAPGTELYARALREGHVAADDAREIPCPVDVGLLHPAVDDLKRLEPVPPVVALHRMLRMSAERIAEARRHEEQLADVFQSLMPLGQDGSTGTGTPVLRVLSGTKRINQAITDAMAEAVREVLTVQPRTGLTGPRGESADAASLGRDEDVLKRGARVRTLYQDTVRHLPSVTARHERLSGDMEERVLDEVPDRLIIVDRAVAFVPADKDGSVAIEIRHPAIVGYLGTAFDRFWRLATPTFPHAAPRPPDRITPRQRAIAELLIEGHTDATIAERLGMNVRTARVHIAKLAATLGSQSRAQLGYLIGQSGILEQEGQGP
ncbi:helix-turn-helix transcriptional regulator [Streptomyces sp. NPDC052012]|uniref:helix-turn-helix transcriptional regulator n=1 Tax=Streptomyces sp. NPDC052012 TaxID=3155051 RepID=UPI00344EBF48